MDGFGALIDLLTRLSEQLDAPALFALLTLQELGIYMPVPGNWLMVYLGVRVAEGSILWTTVLGAATAATIVGSCVLYLIAQRGGRRLVTRFGPSLGLTAARQDRIERALDRHGMLAVYVGRLLPGFRAGSSVAAGLFGVPFAKFLVATAAAALTWWGFWLWLGWHFGPPLLARLERSSGDVLGTTAALSAAVLLFVAGRMLWRRYSGRARLAASADNRSASNASTRRR